MEKAVADSEAAAVTAPEAGVLAVAEAGALAAAVTVVEAGTLAKADDRSRSLIGSS